MSNKPLVSIGLPTYNRAAALGRAIESVLKQDYENIELLISDNASTDETEAICLRAARHDDRLKYLRQQTNQGGIPNFRAVLTKSSGEFFMWLGDDDWLDRSYIARCMETLTEHPDYALVCGEARYYQDDRLEFDGEIIDLLQPSGVGRVLSFYERVIHNGAFYGVIRRQHISSDWLQNVFGADWLLVAAIAFRGKIETIPGTTVSRCRGGASKTAKTITETLGISNIHAHAPFLSIAIAAFKDIAWKCDAYIELGRAGRLSLAGKVFLIFTRRYFKPYWRELTYPYWAWPILFAISVRDRIRKRYLG
jgi:glycosyltransferase involved in cell wall biosynthesis